MGGSVGNTVKRAGLAGITGGLSEFARQDPFGAEVGNLNPVANIAKGVLPSWATGYQTPNIGGSGPFQLDPNQLASDQLAIKGLGDSQDVQNQKFITDDAASRDSSRAALAQALTNQGQEFFRQGLPQTEETLNAQHLLNGSGLGQEIARQQGYLASNIANQVGLQGEEDLNRSSDQKAAALKALQGVGQSGLGRQLSLEDFINQANVAKTIGAQTAPQVGNGKGQTGALLSGVGSVAAPIAKIATK